MKLRNGPSQGRTSEFNCYPAHSIWLYKRALTSQRNLPRKSDSSSIELYAHQYFLDKSLFQSFSNSVTKNKKEYMKKSSNLVQVQKHQHQLILSMKILEIASLINSSVIQTSVKRKQFYRIHSARIKTLRYRAFCLSISLWWQVLYVVAAVGAQGLWD